MTTRRDTVYNGKTRTYAKRNAKGEFVERVTHKRASRQDQRVRTDAEIDAAFVRATRYAMRVAISEIVFTDMVMQAWAGRLAARKSARAAKRKAGGK